MANITASEIAGLGVGALLLCATVAAPEVDAFISASLPAPPTLRSHPPAMAIFTVTRKERKSWRKNHLHGFVAKPEMLSDGSVNLMLWHCTILEKNGSRGSTRDGTGVHDSIVNQLLTKIDGVESLNNVLLIGMTNRKDLLDEALLSLERICVGCLCWAFW